MRRLSNILWFKSVIFYLAFAGFLLTPFQLQAQRGVEIKSKEELSHKSGKLGTYKALVIGINNYQDKKIPALKTAVNDAKVFANLLQTRYGFQVTLLLDRQATRQAIIDKMRDFAASTSPDESVLIYYAGHGEIDRVLNDGWWVPADATGGNPATYLDNNYVQRVMKGMKARHVLLVSDACYSGTLFGESRSLPPVIDDRYYLNLYNEKSRWGMTSGNKTPVSDSGSEGHSIFAYQLIKALKKNEKPYITTQELYNQIAPIIANNSEQQPLCSPVRDTGDQGGGFVFVASTPASFPPSYVKKSAPQAESDELARLKAALEQEKQELAREKQELERQKALDAERARRAAVLTDDAFATHRGAWFTGTDADKSATFEGRQYIVTGRDENRCGHHLLSSQSLNLPDAFDLEMTVTWLDGIRNKAYGLRVASASFENNHLFGITATGASSVQEWRNAVYQQVLPMPWRPDTGRQGDGTATNLLRLEVRGRSVAFVVNGTRLTTVNIPYELRYLGVAVDAKQRVRFESMRIIKRD